MAIVVDEPIINNPFAEPSRHSQSRDKEADLVDLRPSWGEGIGEESPKRGAWMAVACTR